MEREGGWREAAVDIEIGIDIVIEVDIESEIEVGCGVVV